MALDRNTLLKLLVAERGPLLGFMYTVCRDRDLAEDMFQNLVVIATEHQPVAQTREQFLSWARTTARYGLYNTMRKQRRSLPLDEDVIYSLEEVWQARSRVTGSSKVEALERCLRSLTPNVRNLLWLRYDKGLSCEEVASELKRNMNAVHVALSRAYKVLAECIQSRLRTGGGVHV
jgi:RNA polymerase sigma-70 factor (ECF subfamily)